MDLFFYFVLSLEHIAALVINPHNALMPDVALSLEIFNIATLKHNIFSEGGHIFADDTHPRFLAGYLCCFL